MDEKRVKEKELCKEGNDRAHGKNGPAVGGAIVNGLEFCGIFCSLRYGFSILFFFKRYWREGMEAGKKVYAVWYKISVNHQILICN